MQKKQYCLCGLGKSFTQCCGRYLPPSTLPAPTAEALMRSRYCAYVLGERTYLLATWHPKNRPKTLNLNSNMQWFSLKVSHCLRGLESDNAGSVAFIAKYKMNGQAKRLAENSHFNKIDGHWYYVGGDITSI